MADAVGLWVIVYFCVTSVNTKDTPFVTHTHRLFTCSHIRTKLSPLTDNLAGGPQAGRSVSPTY